MDRLLVRRLGGNSLTGCTFLQIRLFEKVSSSESRPCNIKRFGHHFFCLHLGGPDTITAYSLEDNELWLRHLLGLAIQFGERIWILRYTSSEHFRDSMLRKPDAGPNYARYMEEYGSKEREGFKVSSGPVIAVPTEGDTSYAAARDDTDQTFPSPSFRDISCEIAFEVIEIELGFMYDVFYTKAVVIYSFVHGFLGRFSLCCISLRCISFISIISAFVAFLITEKQAYSTVDVIITYVLFAGAIVLELYAAILLLCSDWTSLCVPSMLPNGIGLIRFRDTCAEANEFFKGRKSISDVNKACTRLAEMFAIFNPGKIQENDKMWELMSHVWVEMLSYAANQCRWNLHGQQLRRGGELLTHVWLLLAHLGITEQFQISQGHARAKLVVH
uniref:DUF4220 domain-containing protein n=1 Tax=Fagus sylvatica TaxID=28930 RepID=A0A2N9G3Y8_FAGSY